MKRMSLITSVLMVVLLSSLACNLGRKTSPTPLATIAVTTQAAMSLQTEVEVAAEELLNKGQTTLSITEEELTSFVALELQKQENSAFQEPQIHLRDGQMQIAGVVQQGNLELNLQLILTLAADSDGRLRYDILYAKIGPLSLPDVLLDQIKAQLDRAFEENIYPQMEEIYIEKITIQDGVLTVQGYKR